MRKNILFLFLALALFTAGVIFLIYVLFSGADQKNPLQTPVVSRKTAQEITAYDRIICGTPSLTEIVFSLDEGHRVVGVSQFSRFPPEARERTDIGGLFNPNKERILSLQPDLILTQGKNETLAKLCKEKGIDFLSLQIETISDLEQAILFLGDRLGAEKNAVRLIQGLREGLQDVRLKVEGRPKKRVFLTMGHTPGDLSGLLTTGKGTFLEELIDIAGGTNIFTDIPVQYPQISKEALVIRKPEVIIEVFTDRLTEKKKGLLLQDWMRLESLPAVGTGNIFILDEDFFLVPGVRIVKTAELLAKILHPEAFDE